MLHEILDELYQFSSVVFIFLIPACLLGIYYWKKLSAPYRWLVAYLTFDLFIELIARWWILVPISNNNLHLLHLLTLGELVIWMCFFHSVSQSRQLRRIFPVLLSVLVALVVANTLFLQPLDTFNSYGKTLVQLTIVVLGLQYEFNFLDNDQRGFNALDNDDIASKKSDRAFVWVNRSVLLYYAGSLFVFMFGQYASPAWKQGYEWLWNFNILLNVFLHFIILIELWKTTKIYRASPIWWQQESR